MSAVGLDSQLAGGWQSDALALQYGDPSVQPPLYGPPVRSSGSAGAAVNRDAYDQLAGSVWGGLMDPLGGPSSDPDDPTSDPGSDVGGDGNGFCGVPPGGDGGGMGGGGFGGGTTGGNQDPVEVEIRQLGEKILEGPYTVSKRDRTTLILERSSVLNTNRPVTARLRLAGDADPTKDFRLMQDGAVLFVFPDEKNPDYHYCDVVIPPSAPETRIEMISELDRDYENDELIVFKLIAHPLGGSTPGSREKVSVLIDDATADLKIGTIANNGELLPTFYEDAVGGHIRVNNDFDNGSEIPDNRYYYYKGYHINALDNDLISLTLTSHLEPDHDYAGKPGSNWFVLDYDSYSMHLFKRQEKESDDTWRSHRPTDRIFLGKGETWEFRVEGVHAGRGQISVRWEAEAMPTRGPIFDQVTANVWNIDLDIDSDNTNGLAAPERSDWEEYLENHSYGIGKLVMLPEGDPPAGDDTRARFVPVPITMEPAILERAIKFDFPGTRARSGLAYFWTQNQDVDGGLIDKPFEDGGHRITPGRMYTIKELKGIDRIWIEPIVAQRGHNTLEGANRERPSDFLVMTGYCRAPEDDGKWRQLVVDDVKYMLNENQDVFYPNLQFDRVNRYWDKEDRISGEVLRDALISEAVYTLSDLPQFGLKLLREDDLIRAGLPLPVIEVLKSMFNPESKGLKAAVYRDFLSPNGKGYVLAFAGTEASYQDIMVDMIQGIGLSGNEWMKYTGYLKQYEPAMKLGYHFSDALTDSGARPRMTGHSLGGGLASAASIAAHSFAVPANTFNAAGLHKNTICFRDDKGNLYPDVPRYPNSFQQFYREQSGTGRIKAYYVAFEALSFLQRNLPAAPVIGQIPIAVGEPIKLYGPLYYSMKQLAAEIQRLLRDMPTGGNNFNPITWLRQFNEWLGALAANNALFFAKSAKLHTMQSVLYGLMVRRDVNDGPYEPRIFDIFGYQVEQD